jgi:hypothetical protein
MKFDIDHTFTGISRAAYEQLFLDETFNEAMKSVAGLKERALLEKREEGGRLFRKIRVVPDRELPAIMKKLVSGDLVNVEESWFDPAKHTVEWTNHMSMLGDKLEMHGVVEFLETPNGARRRLTGELRVHIFGVGKLIEKAVVDNVIETYGKIAPFTQQWIDQKKVA